MVEEAGVVDGFGAMVDVWRLSGWQKQWLGLVRRLPLWQMASGRLLGSVCILRRQRRLMMSLQLRWVGESELDCVAETRVLCYAHSKQDLGEWRKYIHNQGRSRAGDYLLAERDGQAIGTATSLRMTMWVRGAAVSCQGVAHVGAIKTERRKGGGKKEGVASAAM